MARPTNKDVRIKDDIEKLRKEAVKQFFGLTPKMYAHIEKSMAATKPCVACFKENGEHKPGKAIDVDGKCAMCHGTYLVPDNVQRNWATEMAQPIVAPAPKTVEMSVENTSSVAELEDEAGKLSDSELDKRLKAVGFTSLMDSEAIGNGGE